MAVAVSPSHRGEFILGTLARVGLSGTALRPLLENVVAADWTRDGKELGVVQLIGGTYYVEFPIGRRLYKTTDQISSLRLSPDGQRLAMFEGSSVSLLDLRGVREVLSTGWFYGNQIAWSPDGKEVWFSASELVPTSTTSKLFAVTLGGKVRTLATAPGGMSLLDVSSAGHVLLRTGSGSGSKGIRFHSGVSAEETDLSWFDWGLVADLSHDSKLLLFSEGGHAGQRGRTAYFRRTDAASAVQLGAGTAQAFSPNETLALIIRVVGSVGSLVSVPIGTGKEQTLTDATLDCLRADWVDDGRVVLVARESGQQAQTFLLNADGAGRRALTSPGVTGTLVSPGGLWLLAARTDQPYALYPMDGGTPRPIPGLDAIDVPIGWTADSTSIFVRRDYQPTAPDVVDVFQVNVGSGRRRLWRRIRVTEFSRVADLLPLAIGGDGRSFAYTYVRGSQNLSLARGLR
jgi:dipeptidyl aminopeptidase/acylaminoacyl peptidase